MDASVISLNSKISHVTWRDEIKTQFARFNEFHISDAATHLMLARHDCMRVDTTRVGFPVLAWVDTVVARAHKIVALAGIFQLVSHISHLHVLLHIHAFSLFDIGTWKCARVSSLVVCSLRGA